MNIKYFVSKLIWQQSWLAMRHKKAAYKNICSNAEAPDAPFTANFFGLNYEGNLSNSIEFNIYYYGAFEKPLLFFLRDTMLNLQASKDEDNFCFCDVGANIGQHSLFMSRLASQVYSFEPYDRVSSRLRSHIELNKIENIAIHDVGLSDKNEELTFYAPTGRNQGIGSFDASTISKGNVATGKLALVQGDEYLESQGIHSMDLIKIDVEGFEKQVLSGLQATLSRLRPVIVTEISYGKDLSFDSMAELQGALPSDYRLYAFNTRKADGSKARKRGAKARKTGDYQLIPFENWRTDGQDDIIACPKEKVGSLPMQSMGTPSAP